jgi:two-component system CheB/CheR fusion protein
MVPKVRSNLQSAEQVYIKISMTTKIRHSALKDFPVVGVGASAGGLKAFKDFVRAIPKRSGMAYVLVSHLSPGYKSMLPEILSRHTSSPVHRIAEDTRLLEDHIYVLPENSILEVTDHTLKLSPRKKGVVNMPIDIFFTSLAGVHRELAVGIVLSGTDGDGTKGLWEIKKNGGTTLAENPESAMWDGMPKSAVEAGVVEFIMHPHEMPLKLQEISYTPGAFGGKWPAAPGLSG